MDEALTKLSKEVECILCHKTLSNPRILTCHHTFCQACLDEIITFQEDGNGQLKCPSSGCTNTVNIVVTETVSSKLSISYMFQNVLHILKLNET